MSTDVAKSTIHPHTRALLEARLPGLREVVQGLVGDDTREDTRHAADEYRRNFPGLDDLTLAALTADFAVYSFTIYHREHNLDTLATACSYASMALELAWEIRGEQP